MSNIDWAKCSIIVAPWRYQAGPEGNLSMSNGIHSAGNSKRDLFGFRWDYALDEKNQNVKRDFFCAWLMTGNWSSPAPTCIPIQCPPLFLEDPHLSLIELNTSAWGRAVFSCSWGYRLSGPPNLECLASGHWSGPIPRCRGKIWIFNYSKRIFPIWLFSTNKIEAQLGGNQITNEIGKLKKKFVAKLNWPKNLNSFIPAPHSQRFNVHNLWYLWTEKLMERVACQLMDNGATLLEPCLHLAAMKVTYWLAKDRLCVRKPDSGRTHHHFVG